MNPFQNYLTATRERSKFPALITNGKHAKRFLLAVCVCFIPTTASASSYLNGPTDEWQLTLMSEAYYLTLNGSLTNSINSSSNINGAFVATADSLNLEDEVIPAFYANLTKNKFALGLYYMPIEYSGSGFGATALVSESLGGFLTIPIKADINLDLMLGNFNYQFIQTESSTFGLGLGAGQVDIDLSFASENVFAYGYQDQQPFGFVNIHMANRNNRFYYGFTLNVMSIELGESSESYTDYKIDFAYSLGQSKSQFDVLFGWRHINLEFDIPSHAGQIIADVEMKGPYLGLSATW